MKFVVSMNLSEMKCQPARAGLKPLDPEKIKELLQYVKSWEIKNNQLQCDFTFKNFLEAMKFVDKVKAIINEEDHYPTITIFYKAVRIQLFSHAINGLGENDFIIAAKIDRLVGQ